MLQTPFSQKSAASNWDARFKQGNALITASASQVYQGQDKVTLHILHRVSTVNFWLGGTFMLTVIPMCSVIVVITKLF